jgi:hypothetical protein
LPIIAGSADRDCVLELLLRISRVHDEEALALKIAGSHGSIRSAPAPEGGLSAAASPSRTTFVKTCGFRKRTQTKIAIDKDATRNVALTAGARATSSPRQRRVLSAVAGVVRLTLQEQRGTDRLRTASGRARRSPACSIPAASRAACPSRDRS